MPEKNLSHLNFRISMFYLVDSLAFDYTKSYVVFCHLVFSCWHVLRADFADRSIRGHQASSSHMSILHTLQTNLVHLSFVSFVCHLHTRVRKGFVSYVLSCHYSQSNVQSRTRRSARRPTR
jgi:hypothetical protein